MTAPNTTQASAQARTGAGANDTVIATQSSLSTRLENVLTRVLAKLDGTSDSLSAFLSPENQQAFKLALANLAQVSRTLAQHGPEIDRAIE